MKPGPDLVICDEGHRIKNSHASISQALKNLKTRLVLMDQCKIYGCDRDNVQTFVTKGCGYKYWNILTQCFDCFSFSDAALY